MDRKTKIAVLGGGNILRAHAAGFVRLEDLCEVAVVACQEEEGHARIRELLRRDVPVCRDFREAIAWPGLDAVDILLPHDLHREAAERAAAGGLHVLCEKVMARDVRECRAMVDACRKAGVELVVAHDRRYAGEWAALKAVIDSGGLGEILFMRMEHNQDVECPEGSWIRSRERLGGGAVMSCLTHQMDALRWYLGEARQVGCLSRTVPGRMEGECIAAVTVRMASGAAALLSINWHTQASGENGLWYEFNHVTGTRGEAYYMSGRGVFARYRGGGGFAPVAADTALGGHQRCVEQFVRLIRGGPADVRTPGHDALRTVEMAEAAYRSEALGRNVDLPLEGGGDG